MKLPLGIQHFTTVREAGYAYVDKTEHIHRLATTGKFCFMSRPRRFGKSLPVSTMHELYTGFLRTRPWADSYYRNTRLG